MSINICDMEAVILCGGLGTRIREETEFRPKPMVEIGGKPILWHIMRHYAAFGVRRFVLCLGYKGNFIRDYFLNYRNYNTDCTVKLGTGTVEVHSQSDGEDWEVVLVETGADSMTGSRIARALPHVRQPLFFATYGDGLCDVDIQASLSHHITMRKKATLTAVRPPSRYGEINQDDNGAVNYFAEKPQMAEGAINGGFFVFDRAGFTGYAPKDPLAESQCFLETDILTAMARDGQLSAYNHFGFWQCMDTYREMQMLNAMWASGDAPWAAVPTALE